MKAFTFLFTLVLTCAITHASFSQEENEFDKRNGFKDIKLASPIDSVKGTEFKKDFKEKGNYPAKLYIVDHPDYKSIGEVAIHKIEIKTYKGLIYEILVITEKDERLMKGLERALGPSGYNVRDETYNWSGKKGSLKFRSHSKNELELLYNSFVVYALMKEDKSKKIDDISDDL